MSNLPSFLVINAYPKTDRETLAQFGVTNASKLYSQLLHQIINNAFIDTLNIADLDAKLPNAEQLKKYNGIVWTGSSLTIYEDFPEVTRQIEFAQLAFEAGIPQFGSCWAAQIAVTAAGGKCMPHPDGIEFGIARQISLTDTGRSHPLYRDKKTVFDGFISHYDEITHLPPGSQILAGNDYTRVQAVSVTYKNGTFWATQYHPEYNLHELARLCYARRERLTKFGFFPSLADAEIFIEDLETLHKHPKRKDIAWRLGISPDLTHDNVRFTEVSNWINELVLPHKQANKA